MNIVFNRSWSKEQISEFQFIKKENDNYCPCMTQKTEDTKCICKDFRQKIEDESYVGECHCGLYEIIR